MKLKVVKEFYDVNNTTLLHAVGSEVDFTDSRAASLIARGLVTPLEEKKPEPKVEVEAPKVEVEAPKEEPKVEVEEPVAKETEEPVAEVSKKRKKAE